MLVKELFQDSNYGFYHYMVRGNCRWVMFWTNPEFIVALNCLALVAYDFGATIYAICVMDNHIHIIFRCLRSNVVEFVRAFRNSLSKNVRREQGLSGSLGSRGYKLVELKSIQEIKDAIIYCFRNPRHHGVSVDIWNYPWSTIRLYFGNGKVDQYKIATDPKFIKQFIPQHRKLPKGWLMTTEGLILPQNYVDVSLVEELFGDEESFREFLKQKTQIEMRNDPNDEMKALVKHTNAEVELIILKYCKDVLGVDKPISLLHKDERLDVALHLIKENQADSKFQISSILEIPLSTLYYNWNKFKK